MAEVVPPKRKYRMVARAEGAAATRERILAAAWERFADQPFEDVRLADVAADAGVTVQTLHSHFGPKDELFVGVWHWVFAPEELRRDSAPVGDVTAAIRLIYDSYELQGDAGLRLLAQEERIPAVRVMTDAGRAWHRAWVERTFSPQLDGLTGPAREDQLVKMVVATDILVWKLLRREMELGRKAAERIVAAMVTAPEGAR